MIAAASDADYQAILEEDVQRDYFSDVARAKGGA
jgi:hypothetical protein